VEFLVQLSTSINLNLKQKWLAN